MWYHVKILQYLDIRSLLKVKESSLIQQLNKEFESKDFERVRDEALSLDYEGRRSINEMIQTHPARRLYLLIERYQEEFPRGTPFVCACEHGRMDDVQLFVNLHPFHKYITNRDVNGDNGNMPLNEMVNQVGKDSRGYEYTPLRIAAREDHFHIVQYLIELCEADPNIADSDGWNALHDAACHNKKNTDLIQRIIKSYVD